MLLLSFAVEHEEVATKAHLSPPVDAIHLAPRLRHEALLAPRQQTRWPSCRHVQRTLVSKLGNKYTWQCQLRSMRSRPCREGWVGQHSLPMLLLGVDLTVLVGAADCLRSRSTEVHPSIRMNGLGSTQ